MLGACIQPIGVMNHGPGDMGTPGFGVMTPQRPLEDARLRASADHFCKRGGGLELSQARAYHLEITGFFNVRSLSREDSNSYP